MVRLRLISLGLAALICVALVYLALTQQVQRDRPICSTIRTR